MPTENNVKLKILIEIQTYVKEGTLNKFLFLRVYCLTIV